MFDRGCKLAGTFVERKLIKETEEIEETGRKKKDLSNEINEHHPLYPGGL